MGRLLVVVGGQFGSEAKGRVAGELALQQEEPPFVIRTGGPNAGHCVHALGRYWKFRQLPTAAVTRPKSLLGIAAGSEVDPALLRSEIDQVEEVMGKGTLTRRLFVDPQSTILWPKYGETESKLVEGIGSTGSGVGAARADRIMRNADVWGYSGDLAGWTDTDVAEMAELFLKKNRTVILEGGQGYGLGLHAGYYPYCSSGDFTAVDVLSAARISPWSPVVTKFSVWVVMRVYPIRVGGPSGPLHRETSWEELGLPEERTTVTNKVRRVGRWDPQLAARAVEANGHNVAVALTMVDQAHPHLAGEQEWTDKMDEVAGQYEKDLGGASIWFMGTGPTTGAWRKGLR